jgi:hypothetical protein
MRLLLIGIAIAVIIYVATSGRIAFLPLIFVLPFGWIASRRR